VIKKLRTVLAPSQINLFKGDTMRSLPNVLQKDAPFINLAYIDGCHDYEVVKSDWLNCSLLFEKNQQLVVAFDDYTYDGVKAVYDEILKQAVYQVRLINQNQFLVYR